MKATARASATYSAPCAIPTRTTRITAGSRMAYNRTTSVSDPKSSRSMTSGTPSSSLALTIQCLAGHHASAPRPTRRRQRLSMVGRWRNGSASCSMSRVSPRSVCQRTWRPPCLLPRQRRRPHARLCLRRLPPRRRRRPRLPLRLCPTRRLKRLQHCQRIPRRARTCHRQRRLVLCSMARSGASCRPRAK